MGNVRFKGVRLGVAAVLFAALLFGQMGFSIDAQVIQYFRDFAMVLFIYTIGLQMGPGFLASLRAEGLQLNLLAVGVIVLGALMAAAIVKFAGLPRELGSGLFTGGFATTPALAAGQDALRQIAAVHKISPLPAVANMNLAYSVAYPFGLTGPILLVIFFRFIFRVDLKKEHQALMASEEIHRPPLGVMDIEVITPELAGVKLSDRRIPRRRGIVFTRLLRGSVQTLPTAATELQIGDVLRATGPKPALDELVMAMGRQSQINLAKVTGGLERASILVTHGHILGKTLAELDLPNRFGVTLARVTRADADLPATAGLKLHFGDNATAIGPVDGLKSVETELGNSTDALNRTQLIPLFLGMWLGVIVGSIPLPIPGLHTPIRIGLAGGPMIVAIILSRLGNIGSVVWYMPPAANQILRDFGMAVFLACVGFQSGDHFLQKLIYGGGLPMIAWGASITLIPMFLFGLYARLALRMNFITLSGLISGAMTSSPTLLFANEATESGAPAVAYAAVYPLSMLVPVFCSQFLVTLLVR